MAHEIPLFTPAFEAGEDLSAKQYHYVKIATGNKVVACTAVTDRPIGVLQNNPAAGQEAAVMVIGITKVVSDAALAVGALIGTSADAQADAKVPGTDTTEYVTGQVLTATGAAGGIATALINCAAPARAA